MYTAQQQGPESPSVAITWHACEYKVDKKNNNNPPTSGYTERENPRTD